MTASQINNQYYHQSADIWWNPDQPLNLLESVVNPARVAYFKKIIEREIGSASGLRALEVGCGGGILAEKIASLGFQTTGVDPSEAALQAARDHAKQSNLKIDYQRGTGEALPFPNQSFDVVFCDDVLEHVEDVGVVVKEIARVLKPGGYFFYDTINRTWFSKFMAIKVWQDWKAFAIMPKDIHLWRMFIKPEELKTHLSQAGFSYGEQTGLAPNISKAKMALYLLYRLVGKLSLRELGQKLNLTESNDMSLLYAGWSRKS